MNTMIPIALLIAGGLLTVLLRKREHRVYGAVVTGAACLIFTYSFITASGPRYINALFALVAAVLLGRALRERPAAPPTTK